MTEPTPLEGIAIVGMAGRFPMAANVAEFWTNLIEGKECFREFSVDELVAAGLPREVATQPNYVRRSPVLANPAAFDPHVFGFSPKEAELIDPQHRIFMECAWEALEDAGHDPHRFDGAIGIWAGCGVGNYFLKNLLSQSGYFEELANFNSIVGNDKDYLASRIAYKFGLRGPVMVVQSACSTSLVAVHQACQALLTYQCDMALAGGVSLQFPRAPGYQFREGEIFSPDGLVRTFDQGANGTVLGEGAGIVVLRRLEEAIADGDRILAVIRGSAVNNDGSARAGYTAPGVAGQAELIEMTQAVAGVTADDISYIETHGTATSLGDPIEVAALTKAFQKSTTARGYCGLSSVKPNVGHLDVAAGVTGLIKTICSLQNRKLPATRHFTKPNPELGLAESPFFVVDRLMDWQPRNGRRIAGVSSFGLGGTNAHVIVEEFISKPTPSPNPTQQWHLLPISAATETALKTASNNLAQHLKTAKESTDLAHVAFTLTNGRQPLRHRLCVVADNTETAVARIEKPDDLLTAQGRASRADRAVVFLFSGQGSQYADMTAGLFRESPIFRDTVKQCARIIGPIGGRESLLDILYATDESSKSLLNQTAITQPALFTIEFALASLWASHGIKPIAVAGHSIGEYVAACVAGVFSLEHALLIVRERARLMQAMEPGTMLAVLRPEAEVRSLMPTTLDLAVINGPAVCVVSGASTEIDIFARALESKGINGQRLHTSHAFHSRMMESAASQLAEVIARVERHAPRLPIASNLSGAWMTAEEAVDPNYWAKQLRNAVRFGDNLAAIAARFESAVLLEIGPGNTLCSLARQQPAAITAMPAVPSVRHPRQQVSDLAYFLRAVGALWCHGASVAPETIGSVSPRKRVELPHYPFEREELYIAARPKQSNEPPSPKSPWIRFLQKRTNKENEAPAATKEKPFDTAPTLESLISLWKQVLGTTQIDPDANFFDLGGHSLLAVTLTNQIERTFGVKLPLSALLNAPTPRQNLQRITQSSSTAGTQSLVSIINQGSRTPVFIFHSHGGNVLEYYRLATLIGKDRPVHALQCHGVNGGAFGPSSMEEMASAYLKEIQAVQPNGPYILGGYCFGGLLAVETALQLQALDQKTALVFMINAATHEYPFRLRTDISKAGFIISKLQERALLELSNFSGKSARDKFMHLCTRTNRIRDLIGVKTEHFYGKMSEPVHTKPKAHSLAYHLEQLGERNDAAWLKYRPRQYDGQVLFFYAKKQPRELQPDTMLGWTGFLKGKVANHAIQGFRQNLLDEPAVEEIAKAINHELAAQ